LKPEVELVIIMPTKEEKQRGGVVRYRTKKLSKNKYIHIAVVRKKGERGGKTVAGPVRTKK
jgi:hypothetical protein